jgi:hypothetical protein
VASPVVKVGLAVDALAVVCFSKRAYGRKEVSPPDWVDF